MKLAAIKEEFEKYFVIKDPWAIEIVLATLIGNQIIERDPIWTMIIGPSSGGKTTLLAPLASIGRVFFVDDMTEKTLLSGYKVKGKDSSLLRTIGSGILAFSDFTSILAKNPVSRGEILTQLKLVYDGKVTKYTGTGSIPWEGKIGFIGAATPDIYAYLESSRSMGERFLYYWLEQPTNDEIMAKQSERTLSSKDITHTMQDMYKSYYEDISIYANTNIPTLKMNAEQRARVDRAAVFCVNGKATIHTNYKTGKPDAIPNISGVGRDRKIFETLLHALQLMNCFEHSITDLPVTDEMIDMVEKCAYSSINRERRKILEILSTENKKMSSSQIGACEGLGLDKESVEQYLAPLHAVGLIKKKAGNPHQWSVEDEWTREFVKRVSPMTKDLTHVEGIETEEEKDELWESVPEIHEEEAV